MWHTVRLRNMNLLQSLQNIDRKITTICTYVDIKSQSVKTNSTKLCGFPGDPGDVSENVDKLCREITYIENNKKLLGFDTYEWITDYIKRYYGSIGSRYQEYMKLAQKFKSAIDQHYSSKCKIEDLTGDGRTGLFEFDFSIPEKSLSLWIKSLGPDEYGNICVYFHVQTSKEIDPATEW